MCECPMGRKNSIVKAASQMESAVDETRGAGRNYLGTSRSNTPGKHMETDFLRTKKVDMTHYRNS